MICLINECVIRADRRHEYNFRSFKLKRKQVLKQECGCENVHTFVVKMIISCSNKRCILDFIYINIQSLKAILNIRMYAFGL